IGFFNYVAAMPLTIWALALALRQTELPSRRTLWTLAAAAVALFYLHLSAFVFFAPAAALVSIAVPRLAPVREWPRKLLWAAPVAVLSMLWLLNSPVVHPESVGWLSWAAFLYLAFPVSIGWMWQLNERYALLFALLLPALLRPARGLRGALPLLLAVATGFFAAGTALANIRAFAREVGPFDEVLARAQPGRRLIGMIFEQNSRYAKFSAFLHF